MKPRMQHTRPDWDRLEREDFERLVEALLFREHEDADKVWSPHDAGGDGGIDVLVENAGSRHIYQLKHYIDGLTSKPDSRKKQIERSFTAALKHKPTDWSLVVPCKVNERMTKFLSSLPSRKSVHEACPDAPLVRIHLLDRPKLDALLARHPDLINLLEREEEYTTRTAAALVQERAILKEGARDVAARAAALGELADDLDPHWGMAFSREGNLTVVQPVPKHARAAQVSPIQQEITVAIPETDQALSAQAEAVFALGQKGTLVIPGQYLSLGKYTGPEAFRLTGDLHALVIMAKEGHPAVVDKPVRLVMRDEDGQHMAQESGRVTYGQLGIAGHTLEFSLAGGVELTLTCSDQEQGTATITACSTSKDVSPAQTRDHAKLIIAISTASEIEIHLDGSKCFLLNGPHTPLDQGYMDHVYNLAEVADDLAIIQRHIKQRFVMPATIQTSECAWSRALRLALEGHVAPLPQRQITCHLRESVHPGQVQDEQAVWVHWQEGAPLEIAGINLHLPAMAITHPRARITVDAANRTATCTPANDEVFVGYFPSTLKDISGHATPWNLRGITEPATPILIFEPAEGGR